MEENQNKQDATSCPNCGKAISIQTEVCPYCNTEINKIPKNENVISKFISKTKENKMPIALFAIFLLAILIFGIYTFNLYGEYTSLQSDNQTLNTKIVDLKDSNTRLQSKLTKANEDYDTLKSDYDELQNKYNTVNAELQNYKDQQATINDLNAKVTELQSQYDSLQAERDSLQQQLDAKKAAQEQDARQQDQQELENQSYGTVYWTPNGECYHSTPNCPTLKRSSSISSGSISSAGGRRPCKVCH